MGLISSSAGTLAYKTKIFPNTKISKSFSIDADEGKLVILIYPSHSRCNDSVSVSIDGMGRTYVFTDVVSWPLTIAKVLDRGQHSFVISFKSDIVNHYVLYTATLETSTVTQPTGPTKPTMPPSPTEPPPVERGCFLFAIGLIALKILMTIVL